MYDHEPEPEQHNAYDPDQAHDLLPARLTYMGLKTGFIVWLIVHKQPTSYGLLDVALPLCHRPQLRS